MFRSKLSLGISNAINIDPQQTVGFSYGALAAVDVQSLARTVVRPLAIVQFEHDVLRDESVLWFGTRLVWDLW